MQDPTQSKPRPRGSAGYRTLDSTGILRRSAAPTLAYVAAAAGFGLAAGVAIALVASHANGVAHSGAASRTTNLNAGLSALPAVYAATAPTLLRSVDTGSKPSASQKTGSSGPQVLTLAGNVPAQKPVGAHKRHRVHKLWNWKKGKRNEVARKPYTSPNTTEAVADEPTGLERATAAAASGPFFLAIEGDVTVASYDVADGRIQTYEGNKFIVDRAAASAGAIRWADFPFDVHYRCDGNGNCTLMRGGASEIAKLTR